MLKPCNISFEQMVIDRRDGRITQDEFDKLYDANCAHCRWMYDVCMYDECVTEESEKDWYYENRLD